MRILDHGEGMSGNLFFETVIKCEGMIPDRYIQHKEIQEFLNKTIDEKLKQGNIQTPAGLKLNIWREKPVTIYNKLEL